MFICSCVCVFNRPFFSRKSSSYKKLGCRSLRRERCGDSRRSRFRGRKLNRSTFHLFRHRFRRFLSDVFVVVFPEEPVRKNDPIRKVKNILFSAHRAGALTDAFYNMGEIVLKDMDLISKNLKPKYCKRAELKTVGLLASKPVAIN